MKPILASEAIGQNGSFKEMHIAHLSHVLLDPKIPLDPKIGQTLCDEEHARGFTITPMT